MGEHRLTRIVTRSGDDGLTGLADGTRLPKAHPRIVAIGEVDELNAAIGLLAVTPGLDAALVARLRGVQQALFDLGGELSLPGRCLFDRAALPALEEDIAQRNAALPPLTEFVLPGSNEANARAHLARTLCRRAERALWALREMPCVETGNATGAKKERDADADDPLAVLARYLNRLSDWLFVLSRALATAESTWRGPGPPR